MIRDKRDERETVAYTSRRSLSKPYCLLSVPTTDRREKYTMAFPTRAQINEAIKPMLTPMGVFNLFLLVVIVVSGAILFMCIVGWIIPDKQQARLHLTLEPKLGRSQFSDSQHVFYYNGSFVTAG